MRGWGFAARVRVGFGALVLMLALFGALPASANEPIGTGARCWLAGIGTGSYVLPFQPFPPPKQAYGHYACFSTNPVEAANCYFGSVGLAANANCADEGTPTVRNCCNNGRVGNTIPCPPPGNQCACKGVQGLTDLGDPNCTTFCGTGTHLQDGICVADAPNLDNATRQNDKKWKEAGCPFGMCEANAHAMLVSLNLNDIPVGTKSPLGPSVFFQLTYNHREAGQPGNFNFSNVGPKWTHNFIAYIEDDVTNPGQNVRRIEGGGGYTPQTGYSGGTFAREKQSLAQLTRTPATGTATSYTLSFADGSSQTYSYAATGSYQPHRLFLTNLTNAQGKSLTLAYDGTNRLTTITDAVGRVTTLSYTNANPLLITKVTDPFGRFATMTYDAAYRLTSITDVLGIVSSFTYSVADQYLIATLTTPYGTSSFAAGADAAANSRWLEITDPLGGTERMEFKPNAAGLAAAPANVPTGITAASTGYNLANSFYWDSYVKAQYGTADYTKAQITHWLTDDLGKTSPLAAMVKPALDNPTYLNYPSQPQPDKEGTLGVPTAVGRKTDATTSQVTQVAYNALGKPTSVTDPRARVTTIAYDASGVDVGTIQQKTSASGYSTTGVLSNYSSHLPGDYLDAAGKHWLTAYTADMQLSSMTNPAGQFTQYFYDAYKRLITVKDTNNAVIRSYHYPCDTSTTGLVNCNLPDWVKEFDGVDPNGYQVSYVYDKLDRIAQVTYPDATTDTYSYSFPAGFPNQGCVQCAVPQVVIPSLDVWKVTDRMGRVTDYSYDQNRRLIAQAETVTVAGVATTRTTSYSYYPNGVLKELTDANGNVTHWDIDLQSRPTAKTYAYGTAAAKTETYTYDLAGRLKTVTDAKAQVLTKTYNADNSLASYAYTNAVIATPGASFTYDTYFPRRTGMTDQFGTTSWTYVALATNGALKPLTENGPFANDSMTQAYDVAGRLNSRTVSGTTAETLTYDTLGRVSIHASQVGSFTYGYLGNTGMVASRTVGTVVTSWGYDTTANDRRLLTISTTGVAARSFTYASNAYQITSITDTASGTHPWLSQTWGFTYDGRDRLLTGNGTIAGNSSFSYDKLDNATSFAGLTGSYDGLNQISTFNALTHSYDANGNLTSDGTRTYTYDAADRLKTVMQGGTTTTFAYDGLGRRLKQTVGATETRYLWCGAAICQQRSNTDTVQKRFVAEGEYVLTGTKKYLYLTDHLGSVRDLIDRTGTPTLVGSFDYTPYGAVARTWGTVSPGYTYAGMFAHPQTGLLLSATRAYDPAKGKWLNKDPIRETGGINLTGYVGGSPTMGVDPSGLCKCLEPPMNTSAMKPYSPGETHTYSVETPVGKLTGDEQRRLFGIWRDGPNAGPGIIPNAPDRTPILLATLPFYPDENWITIQPVEGQYAWINVTMPGHIFADGWVWNGLVTHSDGTTYLKTVGMGNTERWLMNDALGYQFFQWSQEEAVDAFHGKPRMRVGGEATCNGLVSQ